MSLNILKVNDLVLGKIEASNVEQWKVQLPQGDDPGFFMPLVLHIFAKPLFSLVIITMRNLPESVHFYAEAPE